MGPADLFPSPGCLRHYVTYTVKVAALRPPVLTLPFLHFLLFYLFLLSTLPFLHFPVYTSLSTLPNLPWKLSGRSL